MSDLAELKVPGPTITALTRPFWAAAAAGRLLVQRCPDCGGANLYPRAICPACWSDRLGWEEASGAARLISFSIVHKPGHPGWAPAAPYVVGLCRLAEGPTMLSNILCNGRAPAVGASLAMTPTRIGGQILPAFCIEEDL